MAASPSPPFWRFAFNTSIPVLVNTTLGSTPDTKFQIVYTVADTAGNIANITRFVYTYAQASSGSSEAHSRSSQWVVLGAVAAIVVVFVTIAAILFRRRHQRLKLTQPLPPTAPETCFEIRNPAFVPQSRPSDDDSRGRSSGNRADAEIEQDGSTYIVPVLMSERDMSYKELGANHAVYDPALNSCTEYQYLGLVASHSLDYNDLTPVHQRYQPGYVRGSREHNYASPTNSQELGSYIDVESFDESPSPVGTSMYMEVSKPVLRQQLSGPTVYTASSSVYTATHPKRGSTSSRTGPSRSQMSSSSSDHVHPVLPGQQQPSPPLPLHDLIAGQGRVKTLKLQDGDSVRSLPDAAA
eukprot:m.171502 g.171502  ORF g.171502 m.171502 type:complete len:354 (-) comp10390_c0_seq6:128-1189(-)